jgi:hypothetical protein
LALSSDDRSFLRSRMYVSVGDRRETIRKVFAATYGGQDRDCVSLRPVEELLQRRAPELIVAYRQVARSAPEIPAP